LNNLARGWNGFACAKRWW